AMFDEWILVHRHLVMIIDFLRKKAPAKRGRKHRKPKDRGRHPIFNSYCNGLTPPQIKYRHRGTDGVILAINPFGVVPLSYLNQTWAVDGRLLSFSLGAGG